METPRFITSRLGTRAALAAHDPPLKIAGLYADLPSQAMAMGMLRDVARNCSAVCKLHSDWWSFDVLQAAHEREAAARVAADADMIWCAANACESLPESARMWANSWSAGRTCRNESECALVALLRCPAEYVMERSPSWTFLSRLARSAGMELFVQRVDCDCHASVATRSQPLLQNDWFPLENRPDRAQVRWYGINE
jgi:hypothetical protein